MKAADLILSLCAVMLLAFLYYNFWGIGKGPVTNRSGTQAIITDYQGHRQILPLNRDIALTVTGPRGDSHIEIKQGEIRFTSSPCPGKQCIHRGWLKNAGEFNACLPNGISILIPDNNTYDSINF